MVLKGPRKTVLGYKIAPNRFKTTYMSVLTSEDKKLFITPTKTDKACSQQVATAQTPPLPPNLSSQLTLKVPGYRSLLKIERLSVSALGLAPLGGTAPR